MSRFFVTYVFSVNLTRSYQDLVSGESSVFRFNFHPLLRLDTCFPMYLRLTDASTTAALTFTSVVLVLMAPVVQLRCEQAEL